MKERDNDSDDIIINASSKVETIKINPPELIPDSSEKSKEKATIENIEKNDNIVNQPQIPGRIGNKGTIELSKDCTLGADAAPADLLKDIVNINPETILSPLLTIRKFCFSRMSVENILKYQKKELNDPLLRMETEDDAEASKQMFRNML